MFVGILCLPPPIRANPCQDPLWGQCGGVLGKFLGTVMDMITLFIILSFDYVMSDLWLKFFILVATLVLLLHIGKGDQFQGPCQGAAQGIEYLLSDIQ